MLLEPYAPQDEDVELLALLRTKGLSIRNLDNDTKEKLHLYVSKLHVDQGMSLTDMAALIGNKTSGYTSWLCRELGVKARPFEEARLKGIREKRRKYERKPFDGTDEDRAYLLGLRHGDLSVSKPWNGVVKVTTSTTHPAMAELFHTLFEPHGHVYQHPRFKKDTGTYEWNLSTILDDSFEFLTKRFEDTRAWVDESEERVISYLSGFLDAEGSILVTRNSRGGIVIFVDFFNENRSILEWIESTVRKERLGTSLRINKPIGRGKTGFHLNHNREYWQLSIFSAKGILDFVRQLHPRHPEKKSRRDLAISTRDIGSYSNVVEDIVSLRTRIKAGVDEFVKLAEETYLKTHPKPSSLAGETSGPKAE